MYITLSDTTQIYYNRSGLGSGKTIIFIHGFTLDHRMRELQVREFESTHDVITYDVRGFGKSSSGPVNLKYTHIQDLYECFDIRGVRSATVVGLSMGGTIALDFTLAYPDLVDSLVLIDSHMSGYKNSTETTNSFSKIKICAEEKGIEAAKELRLDHELFRSVGGYPTVFMSLKKIVGAYHGKHRLGKRKATKPKVLAIDSLESIKTPTCIIVGSLDLGDFQNIARILADRISDSTYVCIEGVGHMANMEASDQCNEILRSCII